MLKAVPQVPKNRPVHSHPVELSIPVSGVNYTVVIRYPGEGGLGEGCEGQCEHDNPQILLSANLASSRLPGVLMHELLHAVFFQSGAQEVGKKIGNMNADEWHDFEEAIVSVLAPSLLGVAIDMLKLLK